MGKLAEYLDREADQLRDEFRRREVEFNEWAAAVARLSDQLRQWVTEADAGRGLLTVQGGVRIISRETADEYPVPGLRISLGGQLGRRSVYIGPRARHVPTRIKPPGEPPRRADGVVEMRGGTTPDYYLYRLKGDTPDGDRWFIRGAPLWDADADHDAVEPLDRDRFEAALLRVLR